MTPDAPSSDPKRVHRTLDDAIERQSPEVKAIKAVFDQAHHDAEANAAWEDDPQAAMTKYGLPCWCGHYGGCEKCDKRWHI